MAQGVLFSHPADYTPVCTTELERRRNSGRSSPRRNVKVAAVSVDPPADHHGWIRDINETQGTTVNFPIIAEPSHGGHPVRHDPSQRRRQGDRPLGLRHRTDKKIKLTLTHSASTGRNFLELR